MTFYDVFNGDADGLCALHQLRLDHPQDALLVTGVKRDVALLQRIAPRAGDVVTVLDISLDVNRVPLAEFLRVGVRVTWFDHHYSGDVPSHPGLQATIDAGPDVCTSILVDRELCGRHRRWAIAAAYGDNLPISAEKLANTIDLPAVDRVALQELGEAISYNSYGESEADLVIAPAALYRALQPYEDPLQFFDEQPVAARIRDRQLADLALARAIPQAGTSRSARIFILPDAPWSRRVHGVFGNELAQRHPDAAHAIVVPDTRGGYTVSVRAPVLNPVDADRLCRRFAGGGRAGAGGIGGLARDRLPAFAEELERAYRPR